MRHTRPSLAGLMAVVCFIALGFAALRDPSPLWASVAFMAAVTLMSAAVLGAIARRGEARMTWAGVATFGWVYLGIVFMPLPNGNGTTIPPLPTMAVYEWALDYQRNHLLKSPDSNVAVVNNIQAETLFGKATLAGKPRVTLDVMDLKRATHSLGAAVFAAVGGFLGRAFHARESRGGSGR